MNIHSKLAASLCRFISLQHSAYRNNLLFVFLTLIVFNSISCIRYNNPVEWEYSKKEVYITMRDGVKLYTAIYSPKDDDEKYPIVIMRTPYRIAPYGEHKFPQTLGPSPQMMKEKFIFVYQDVRGRFMSEGEFVDMRPYIPNKKSNKDIDESSDTYDTIEWLVNNVENNNGKAGLWGISYPGFYAVMGCIDAHPALKAAAPQAPLADWFIGDDFHHNGALFLSDFFGFYGTFGQKRPSLTKEWPKSFAPDSVPGNDGYSFYKQLMPLKKINELYYKGEIPFWNDVAAHPDYDESWQARNTLPHLKNIKPAVLVTGGWFDAEDLYGITHTYKEMKKQNPDGNIYCAFGPWFHGGWARSDGNKLGDISFDSNTGPYFQESIELPFFNYYLKGKGTPPKATAYIFETGANKWHELDSWPPKDVQEKSLFITADNKLSFSEPVYTGSGSYAYTSDPYNPVPYTGVKEFKTSREFMVEDQRFLHGRNDVLTFSTDELTENVSIAGPITANLYVTTTGTDADFVVKVIDVFPSNEEGKMANYQMLLRWEIMRGKYRNSYKKPEPFKPGVPTKVKFQLHDVSHTFKKGHKIMVQIQSSFFPMADMNPQTFTNIYTCDSTAFKKAKHSLLYSKQYPSSVNVNLVIPK